MKNFITAAILLLCACFYTMSQEQFIVSGVVTDKYGEVPGILVVISGTKKGAVTDLNGVYSIACSPSDKLIFSGLGYITQTISVDRRRTIDVNLELYGEYTE